MHNMLFDSYLYSSREQSSSITNKFFNIEIHDVIFPLSILIPKIFFDEGDSVQAETGTTVPLNQNKRIAPHFPGALIAGPEKKQRNLKNEFLLVERITCFDSEWL
jgi:hypothetical protein